VEVQKTCGLLQLTQIGGRSSGEEESTSLTSTIERQLMSIKTRMLKANKLLFTRSIMAGTRDGESFILTKLPRLDPRDTTVNLVSISIDQCSSDQDFQ
jgi:hypothetical protein